MLRFVRKLTVKSSSTPPKNFSKVVLMCLCNLHNYKQVAVSSQHRWLDPGAFGTLGVGGGFALGAKLCNPDHDVWVVYGDGSLGYSVAEFDTFLRHKVGDEHKFESSCYGLFTNESKTFV